MGTRSPQVGDYVFLTVRYGSTVWLSSGLILKIEDDMSPHLAYYKIRHDDTKFVERYRIEDFTLDTVRNSSLMKALRDEV